MEPPEISGVSCVGQHFVSIEQGRPVGSHSNMIRWPRRLLGCRTLISMDRNLNVPRHIDSVAQRGGMRSDPTPNVIWILAMGTCQVCGYCVAWPVHCCGLSRRCSDWSPSSCALTVILLPVGLPLLGYALRLYSMSLKLVLPRAVSHPVDTAERSVRHRGRTAKKDLAGAAPDLKKVRQRGRDTVRRVRKRVPLAS